MAKHTPGPWEVEMPGPRDQIQAIAVYGPAEDGRTEIAWDVKREANARLIAAAPDLLEALKAVEEFEAPTADLRSGGETILRTIRAAIAKAEGN